MSTVDKIKNDRRVEHLDHESDGYIVTLRRGWTFDSMCDNRVAGEDTVSALLKTLRKAKRYDGPYTT